MSSAGLSSWLIVLGGTVIASFLTVVILILRRKS